MSTDPKFRKLHMKYAEKFFGFYWMWETMMESAAKDGGWFRQSAKRAHDEDSMFIAFELTCRTFGTEIIDEFLTAFKDEGLINVQEDGFIYIKNWEKYQHSKLSTPYVQQHRENKRIEDDTDFVLLEFNKITGKNFRIKTENYRKLIRGRLKDGYGKADLVAVIRHKQRDWISDRKMKKFITPETLFRPGNFDRYLNEIPKDSVKEEASGGLLKVMNIYGHIDHITQKQLDQAEPGFWKITE